MHVVAAGAGAAPPSLPAAYNHSWHIISAVHELNDSSTVYTRPQATVLSILCELGFIASSVRVLLRPQCSLWYEYRIQSFLMYLDRYLSHHPTSNLTAYFTLYDGWREHTPPAVDPVFVVLPSDEIRRGFLGRGTAKEPGRFLNRGRNRTKTLFPVFKLPVIAYSRHKGDPSVLLIPDGEFLQSDGFLDLRKEVDSADIAWHEKKDTIVWRGTNAGKGYETYNVPFYNQTRSKKLYNQRELFINFVANNSAISAYFVKHSDAVTKKMLLSYKFQLDLDGEVNAWSGLFWKLYSNSAVFKVRTSSRRPPGSYAWQCTAADIQAHPPVPCPGTHDACLEAPPWPHIQAR